MPHPMPPSARPTVGRVRWLEASLEGSRQRAAELEAELANARAGATQMANERARLQEALEGQDREAKALAQCITAFEAMHAPIKARTPGWADPPMPARWGNTDLPDALQTPEGRVLLHLAARYGVDLIPRPTVVPHDPGPVLMELPRDLADRITAMEEAKHRWE